MRVTAISTPSTTGSAPPDRPEPAPRATHGTPSSEHARTTSRTSPALPGRTTAPGVTRYCSSPSDSYVRSWIDSVSTCSLPQIARRRSSSARPSGAGTEVEMFGAGSSTRTAGEGYATETHDP